MSYYIDNIYYSEEAGNVSIFQKCSEKGIDLPCFCYHENLSIAGNCRMCLVEINTSIKLVVSCAIPIQKKEGFINLFGGGLKKALISSNIQIKYKNLFNNRLNIRRNYTPYGKFKYKHIKESLIEQFNENFKIKAKKNNWIDEIKEKKYIEELKEFKLFLKKDSEHEKFYDAEIIELEGDKKIVILKAYNGNSNTNSIYGFGEENKKIELKEIFKNTGVNDSISSIGIKLEIKFEDLDKIINLSDMEKLKKGGVNKEEMEKALKKVTEIINNLEDKKTYNLNKGGEIENINLKFKGDEIITTEELFKNIRKDDVI